MQGLKKLGWASAPALALCLAQAASAAVVFNNGAPDQVSGTNMSANMVAEDFTIGATTDITNLRFWTIQSALGDYSGSLSWAIYGGGAQPGAVLFSGTSAATAVATGGSSGFGYAEYVFDITTLFQLSAGSYWLGLGNNPLDPSNPSEMLWETTGGSTGSKSKYLDVSISEWIDSGNDQAFRIDGTPVVNPPPPTIPEPGTLALLAISVAAAGFVRRKA
jgi:hypothetical protein